MQKIIITAALTGGIATRDHSPYIPYTPEEIAEEVYRCYQAGASIVHIHARDPETGRPTWRSELYREYDRLIREKCDIIINHSTTGAIGLTHEQRLAAITEATPDMASLNMGDVNAIYFDPKTNKRIEAYFSNPFSAIEKYYKTMVNRGIKPELEIYDVGMIYKVKLMIDLGIFKPPLHCQFVLGLHGEGMPATPRNLINMLDNFRELLPPSCTWSACAVGRHEFPIITLAMILGGHVRVGLEDNLYLAKGVLAKSNADLVAKVVRIANELGYDIATPSEARKILTIT